MPRKRKIIKDPKGGMMSSKEITINDRRINKGKPTNIPTIFNKVAGGPREVTQRAAINRVIRAGGKDPITGKKLRSFGTMSEAVTASKNQSRAAQKRLTDKRRKT